MDTSKLEFKEHKAFTDALDRYVKMLVAKGCNDREILKFVYPMIMDIIILRGGKNERPTN